MPCCVPIDVDRESSTCPYKVPIWVGCYLPCVGEAEGLDVARGVGCPEAEQRPAGELMVLEVGGGLDAGTTIVDLDHVYRVGPSGVGKGIPAGQPEYGMGRMVPGRPGFDLPDSDRSIA